MDHARIIEKVRKLLALSLSDNEHEAASAAAKAQELLSEYNLSMSDIPAHDPGSAKATHAQAHTRKSPEPWMYLLAGASAKAFDCAYFFNLAGMVFVGVGADQEVCAWTYAYLYKTLLRMGSTYLRTQCRRLRVNRSKAAARESYLCGVIFTISRRLQEQKERTPITESALVPVKQRAIDAAMPNDLVSKDLNFRPCRDDDMYRGIRDGEGIPLSTPLNATQRAALQSER
jgi:hypothetical protein